MLFIVWRLHAVLAVALPSPGSACVRECVCEGVRARAGVGARGERPENTLVCTERPFAAGEFVFFHFCSTFSQAASCLVSATLNNNNNQHKKN